MENGTAEPKPKDVAMLPCGRCGVDIEQTVHERDESGKVVLASGGHECDPDVRHKYEHERLWQRVADLERMVALTARADTVQRYLLQHHGRLEKLERLVERVGAPFRRLAGRFAR